MQHEIPLSIIEAARQLGVSEQVVRLALQRGDLDGFKLGRVWRIFPGSIARVMAGETRIRPRADGRAA